MLLSEDVSVILPVYKLEYLCPDNFSMFVCQLISIRFLK